MRNLGPVLGRKTFFVIACVFALALAAGLFAVSVSHRQVQYMTATASYGEISKTVLATGRLEPFELVNVGSRATGQVESLKVRLGQNVKKGDLIAELDSKTQQNDLENARAALQNLNAQRVSALANLDQAQAEFERQQKLREADVVSQADLEAAKKDMVSAQSSVQSLDAQIVQGQIAEKTSAVNLSYTRITAPISGTVLSIVSNEGQTVNAVQAVPTIVRLGQVDKMVIRAQISEADIVQIKAGMTAFFSVLGEPDKNYMTRVDRVDLSPTNFNDTPQQTSPQQNATFYYGIFNVDNADGHLLTYMTANVSIVVAEDRHALTIPTSALGRALGDRVFEVRMQPRGSGSEPITRRITTGIDDGAKIQVLSGLMEGDKVVLGSAESRPGEHINGG